MKDFPGHLNWFTATYEGQASWTDSNFDDDWNVALVPTGTAAVMADRFDIHTEFDSDEMDIKDFFGTWWKAVYSAAENGDKFSVKPVFAPNGDIHAIMTGMFGIDCEHAGGPHDCKSELHPVYAMAAHIHDDPTDDAWAMFVRNNGDEGFCSSKLVPDDFRTYTFHFPWRAGKTGVSIRPGTIWGGYPEGVQAPEITWLPDRGIDVTFELPPSDQSPLIEGELHLEWIGQAPVPPLLPVIIARPAPGSEEETDVFTAAVAKVRLDQRQELNGISNWNNKQKHVRTLPLRPAKQVRDLASETGKVISGRRIDPPATAKQTRDLEKMRALCKFAGSKAQASLQQACSRLPQ